MVLEYLYTFYLLNDVLFFLFMRVPVKEFMLSEETILQSNQKREIIEKPIWVRLICCNGATSKTFYRQGRQSLPQLLIEFFLNGGFVQDGFLL